MQLRGLVHVDAGDPLVGVMLFVFTAEALRRKTFSSDEGALHWISRGKLLDCDLVEDLYVLLPRVLSLTSGDPPLSGCYHYDADDRLVVKFADCHLPDTS
jgi:hypothetical protein